MHRVAVPGRPDLRFRASEVSASASGDLRKGRLEAHMSSVPGCPGRPGLLFRPSGKLASASGDMRGRGLEAHPASVPGRPDKLFTASELLSSACDDVRSPRLEAHPVSVPGLLAGVSAHSAKWNEASRELNLPRGRLSTLRNYPCVHVTSRRRDQDEGLLTRYHRAPRGLGPTAQAPWRDGPMVIRCVFIWYP